MSGLALLTVIAPVAIEEVLVDWLLENAPELGFSSGPINGHLTPDSPCAAIYHFPVFRICRQESKVYSLAKSSSGGRAMAGTTSWRRQSTPGFRLPAIP